VLNGTPGCSTVPRMAVWSVCTTRPLAISSVPSILPLERHTRGIGGIQVQQAEDTTVGHLEASQASELLVMDSQDPIIRHCHQPIGSVSLLNVPVAVRSDRHCLRDGQSGTAAICRIDPDIES